MPPTTEDDPQPGAYRPYLSARYPGVGKAPAEPIWRVLVHHKHLEQWKRIMERCGESNANELWEHLTTQPNQPPRLGTVTPMKGKQYAATSDGMSRVYHYEVTGGARVDYRFNAEYVTAPGEDKHRVVQIISIDLGSH